jgi:hypothetical protein
MRIFVSSSFEDLREHRAAAIRVLRQLGHEVLAMEDMVAGSTAPLTKVLEMVDRSEAYVGVFAWRYGHVPGAGADPPQPQVAPIPPVDGAVFGETSITHFEYLRAVQRTLPVMAFLLDEQYPWPPQLIDGFDRTRAGAPADTREIRALRQALQQERIVSWFTTATDLEARVSAAVTMAGLTRQLDLQPATALPADVGIARDSASDSEMVNVIAAAGEHQRALKIDLNNTWWSTRLYLVAALAQRLTQIRRILIVDTRPASASTPTQPRIPLPGANQPFDERFVGQLSTSAILATIEPKLPELGAFANQLQARPSGYGEISAEIGDVLNSWRSVFADLPGVHTNETTRTVEMTAELLRR